MTASRLSYILTGGGTGGRARVGARAAGLLDAVDDRRRAAVGLVLTHGLLDALTTAAGMVATTGNAVEGNAVLQALHASAYHAVQPASLAFLPVRATTQQFAAAALVATGVKLAAVALAAFALHAGWRYVEDVPGRRGILLALLASGVLVPATNVLHLLGWWP